MKKQHLPNLDALRTIAFLFVFFYHSFHTDFIQVKTSKWYELVTRLFKHGELGVNFFFVLSGFLITYLLVIEEGSRGRINLINFYMRRVLRIWPLYFASVCFGFVVFPYLKLFFGQIPSETADVTLFLTFLSNFNNIFNGLPDASILGVLWSVSIEEQFYIFWPLLLIIFKKSRIFIISILIVVNISFRYMYSEDLGFVTQHSLGVLANLAVGCACGLLVNSSNSFRNFFQQTSLLQNGLLYMILIILIFLRSNLLVFHSYVAIDNFIFSLLFAWVILEQLYSKNSILKFGSISYLQNNGKYTYGLYCLHFLGILTATTLTKLLNVNDSIFSVLFLETFMALIISHFLAVLSYRFFEKPFLSLKEKYN